MLAHGVLPPSAASGDFLLSHSRYSPYSVDAHSAPVPPLAGFSSRASMPPCLPSVPAAPYAHHTQQQQPFPSQHAARPHWSSNDSTASSSSSSSSCSSTPPLSSAAPPASSPSASQFPPPLSLSLPSPSASSPGGSSNGNKPRAPRFVDTFQSRILKQPLESELSPSSLVGRPKRKRRAPVLDPTTKVIRSQKHNEAEVRRRQRLNNLLLELAEVVGCRKPQKGAILRLTLEKVRGMERKIAAMEDKMKLMDKEKEERDKADRDRAKASGSSVEEASREKERGGGELVKVAVDGGGLGGPSYECSSSSSSSGGLADSISASPMWSSGSWGSACFGSSSSSSSVVSPSPLPLCLFPMGSMASPQPLLTMAGGFEQSSTAVGFPSPTPLPSIASSASSITATSLSALTSPLSQCAPSPIIKREQHLSCLHPSSVPSHPSSYACCSSSVSPVSSRFELIHSATVAMNVVDLNGRALDCNRQFAAFLGCSRAAVLSPSASFFDWTHPDSLNLSVEMLSRLITNGRSTVRGVKRYITKSGRIRAATCTVFMCEDATGRPNQVAAIVEPIDDEVHGCMMQTLTQ